MTSRCAPRAFAILLACVVLEGGCRTYETAYAFSPSPNIVPVPAKSGGTAGMLSALVVGAREGSGGASDTIVVRLRVERPGVTPVAVLPESLRLLAADRRVLVPQDVKVIGPANAAAGGAATSEVAFAVPPPGRLGSIDLSRLDLVVPVDVAGERQTITLAFSRDLPEHPWMDPWGRTPLGGP